MTLTEGRNRQIRIMLQEFGYEVEALHRIEFLGIDLSGLQGPGDWTRLNASERSKIDKAVARAEHHVEESS